MVDLIPGIRSTSSALQAERLRMEIVGQNIANINTTKAPDGKPYQRQQLVFESVLNQEQRAIAGDASSQSVRVARIEKDQRPARLIYCPGHPEANDDGMLAVPNMSIHEEMADLIASSRAYEANLAVAKNARTMALQALSIGKR